LLSKHPEIKAELKDFTSYENLNNKTSVKIPFSFHQNSIESKKLISGYKAAQEKVNDLLEKKEFLQIVLNKLGFSFPVTLTCSKLEKLEKFFTGDEIKALPKIISVFLNAALADQNLSQFVKGLKDVDKIAMIPMENFQDVLFFDDLRKCISNEEFKSKVLETACLFKKISKQKNIQSLIENRLYYRVIKKADQGSKEFSQQTQKVKIAYLIKDLEDRVLDGNFEMIKPPVLRTHQFIPGLYYSLQKMKVGEEREVYIHPDLAYGYGFKIGDGKPLIVTIRLLDLENDSKRYPLPNLKPYDLTNTQVKILSCQEFNRLQNKYSYFCGLRTGLHYKKASVLFKLNEIISLLEEQPNNPLSEKEKLMLLKLEWLLYSNSR
jgi:FKBP-type peptidyl-prolyl cis-trans isomerase